MKTFKSTEDYPAPSFLPFGEPEDDIAAVLADSKPAAMIEYEENNKLLLELIKIAEENAYFISYCENHVFICKDKIALDQLVLIYNTKSQTINERIVRSTIMGKLLGYCDESINDFIEYGIKKNMNYKKREYRRRLNKLKS